MFFLILNFRRFRNISKAGNPEVWAKIDIFSHLKFQKFCLAKDPINKVKRQKGGNICHMDYKILLPLM